jgi:copper(I)-binding protein
MKQLVLIATLAVGLSATAHAQVTVKDPWVRATVPAQKATGAFMQISAPQDAKLVEVRTPVGTAEIHEMRVADNVMKMREITALDLPAGKTVELKPGSYHVMIVDLKAQVKAGDTVPLTLVVEGKDKKRETIEVKAVARALGGAAMPAGGAMPAGEHKHSH